MDGKYGKLLVEIETAADGYIVTVCYTNGGYQQTKHVFSGECREAALSFAASVMERTTWLAKPNGGGK